MSGLTPFHFISPMSHVAVLMDGNLETRDPQSSGDLMESVTAKGGVSCMPVPVYSGESDAVFMERILCIGALFHQKAPYDFFGYNCGGFTKDVLDASGSGLPITPNAGVGAQTRWLLDDFSDQKRTQGLIETKAACEQHVHNMMLPVLVLESGRNLPDDSRKYLESLPHNMPSGDMLLQLFISAARGKNEENRKFIERLFSHRVSKEITRYLEKKKPGSWELRPKMREWLEKAVQGLSAENRIWLEKRIPELSSLHR